MKREQLEHIIRSATAITKEYEVFIKRIGLMKSKPSPTAMPDTPDTTDQTGPKPGDR